MGNSDEVDTPGGGAEGAAPAEDQGGRAPGVSVTVSKRLVLVNSLSNVLTGVLQLSVLLWLKQHLLRRISPEEYSIYPLIAAVMLFAPILTTALTGGLARYATAAYAKRDEGGVTRIVSTMLPLLIVAAAFLLAAGSVFSWFVPAVLGVQADFAWQARAMMALMIFQLFIRLLAAPFNVGFHVRQKFVLQNVIRLATQLLFMGILFVLLFAAGPRVVWVAVASTASETVGLGVSVSLSRSLLPALRFRRREIHWPLARRLVSFGGWTSLVRVANCIRLAADPVILKRLASAVDVASYDVGTMPYRCISSGTQTAFQPLQPALTVLHSRGDRGSLRSAYLRGGRYALWLAMAAVVPLVVFRHELLALYLANRYTTYAPAASVMLLTLGIYPFVYGNSMMHKLACAAGQVRPYAIRAVVLHAVNLGLTVYFVGFQRMGAVGCALPIFLIAAVGHPLLHWPLGLRLANVRFRTWARESLVPGLLPALFSGAICEGLRRTFPAPSSLGFAALITCAMTCYLITLVTICMNRKERAEARRLMASVARGIRFAKGC